MVVSVRGNRPEGTSYRWNNCLSLLVNLSKKRFQNSGTLVGSWDKQWWSVIGLLGYGGGQSLVVGIR